MASVHNFAKGNITSLDDKLLAIGIIAMILAVTVLIACSVYERGNSQLQLLWAISISGAGVLLLFVEFQTRKQEKKCVGLWRLLQTHPEFRLSLYLQQSNNSLSDVRRAAKTINDFGAGLLVVDVEHDRLFDSRLTNKVSVAWFEPLPINGLQYVY